MPGGNFDWYPDRNDLPDPLTAPGAPPASLFSDQIYDRPAVGNLSTAGELVCSYEPSMDLQRRIEGLPATWLPDNPYSSLAAAHDLCSRSDVRAAETYYLEAVRRADKIDQEDLKQRANDNLLSFRELDQVLRNAGQGNVPPVALQKIIFDKQLIQQRSREQYELYLSPATARANYAFACIRSGDEQYVRKGEELLRTAIQLRPEIQNDPFFQLHYRNAYEECERNRRNAPIGQPQFGPGDRPPGALPPGALPSDVPPEVLPPPGVLPPPVGKKPGEGSVPPGPEKEKEEAERKKAEEEQKRLEEARKRDEEEARKKLEEARRKDEQTKAQNELVERLVKYPLFIAVLAALGYKPVKKAGQWILEKIRGEKPEEKKPEEKKPEEKKPEEKKPEEKKPEEKKPEEKKPEEKKPEEKKPEEKKPEPQEKAGSTSVRPVKDYSRSHYTDVALMKALIETAPSDSSNYSTIDIFAHRRTLTAFINSARQLKLEPGDKPADIQRKAEQLTKFAENFSTNTMRLVPGVAKDPAYKKVKVVAADGDASESSRMVFKSGGEVFVPAYRDGDAFIAIKDGKPVRYEIDDKLTVEIQIPAKKLAQAATARDGSLIGSGESVPPEVWAAREIQSSLYYQLSVLQQLKQTKDLANVDPSAPGAKESYAEALERGTGGADLAADYVQYKLTGNRLLPGEAVGGESGRNSSEAPRPELAWLAKSDGHGRLKIMYWDGELKQAKEVEEDKLQEEVRRKYGERIKEADDKIKENAANPEEKQKWEARKKALERRLEKYNTDAAERARIHELVAGELPRFRGKVPSKGWLEANGERASKAVVVLFCIDLAVTAALGKDE